jgi:sugar transferase (PEP-CTERM/EpsH1 system associated)
VRPYHFIRELAGRHDVTVLATGSRQELADAAGLRSLCRRVEVVPLRLSASLRSCAAAAFTGEPLQAAFCRSTEMTDRLEELLANQRFDIVHVEHLRAAYLGTAISTETPTVFDAVDCISLLQERTLRSSHSLSHRGLAALELHRTRRYEAQLLHRFNAVLATSADDARALQALAPGREVAVVPNGVDLEHFRPMPGPPEPATLVFSGKMSYHANVSAVLYFVRKVLPLIRAVRPDVQVRVVGSNPPRAVRDLNDDPAITVTGRVPDMREALGRATLAICPVTVKVGIQNKALEAMAMGLPVVATRLGAEGLAAHDGRDLLVADDEAGFAERVLSLLADPVLRASVAAAGRRYVERHHRWEAATRTLEDLYHQAASGPRPRLGTAVVTNST